MAEPVVIPDDLARAAARVVEASPYRDGMADLAQTLYSSLT